MEYEIKDWKKCYESIKDRGEERKNRFYLKVKIKHSSKECQRRGREGIQQ